MDGRSLTDDGKHLGGTVSWSVDGSQIASLTLNWDGDARCGDLDIPAVPTAGWKPADVATLRAVLADVEAVLRAWVERGKKPGEDE